MKETLDYRLEIAEQRGLRVKALKVTWEELEQLLVEQGYGGSFPVGVTNWWYHGVRLRTPPLTRPHRAL
jgi:hypothetical protein